MVPEGEDEQLLCRRDEAITMNRPKPKTIKARRTCKDIGAYLCAENLEMKIDELSDAQLLLPPRMTRFGWLA